MQWESYFMTQESEDAARGRLLEEYRKTNERLNLPDNQMKQISQELSALADVLKNPRLYSLLVEAHTITIGKPDRSLERPIAVIKDSSLNVESLGRLWLDYRSTLATKNDLSNKLKPYIGE
jgi:hypothetical protein